MTCERDGLLLPVRKPLTDQTGAGAVVPIKLGAAEDRYDRRSRSPERLALAGAFGPVAVEREETIEEFHAEVGCSVADVLASQACIDAKSDVDDGDV